ncbi:MAG TPA: SEL1-like repeat protein [Ramlibacter sp.]|nr:SEL1-like repeat protein [Ramlibacter sp.]
MSTLAVVTVAVALAVAGVHHQQPPQTAAATRPADPVLERARQAEADGRFAEATRIYREAVAGGSGAAAKRLGDLYLKGAPGVERDQAQALRWYREAELRGEVLAQAIRLR